MACFALPSCSLIGKGMSKMPWKKKKTPAAAKNEDVAHLIGTVAMVNPEQRFVLIRTQGKVPMSAGQELTVLDSSGAESKIKVSPEKKLDFLTADILSGNPSVGGMVFFKLDKKALPPVDPNPPPTPPPPSITPVTVPDQPPPSSPVSSSEFLKPGANLPVPPPPGSPSPIPPQPTPQPTPGAAIPVPGQIQLPPVVR